MATDPFVTNNTFYHSWHEAMKRLSPEQYGKLAYALNEYCFYGAEPENLEFPLDVLFISCKPNISASTARKRAGKTGGKRGKGGAPKGNTNASKDENKSKSIAKQQQNNTEEEEEEEGDVNVNDNVAKAPFVVSSETTQSQTVDKTDLIDQRFNEFWAAYPRKQGKGEAKKKWLKLKPDATLHSKILSAIGQAKQSDQWRKNNGQYIPNPATWLNQGRWEDELQTAGGIAHGDNNTGNNGFNQVGMHGFKSALDRFDN